jgi:Ca2+-binding EF-hand superfamily protein
MNFKHNVTMEDVKHSLKQIDANHDGKVTKRELYNALKVIIGGGKPSTGRKEANLPYEQNKQPKYV